VWAAATGPCATRLDEERHLQRHYVAVVDVDDHDVLASMKGQRFAAANDPSDPGTKCQWMPQ